MGLIGKKAAKKPTHIVIDRTDALLVLRIWPQPQELIAIDVDRCGSASPVLTKREAAVLGAALLAFSGLSKGVLAEVVGEVEEAESTQFRISKAVDFALGGRR